jgi:alpha-tubulin suppressor-like RCC1 family protein
MKVLRSRRLAGLAACAVLVLGVAAAAGAVPARAQARGTAAVAPPRVVASWGLNNTGQLGNGTTTDRALFGDIGAGNNVVQVDARYDHGLAVRSDGTVWAWGNNELGELGDGTTTSRLAPVQVTGLTGVTQVAAGQYVSLALRSDGTVWAWGANLAGQLGRGTTSDHEVTPARVTGLAGVVKISAGDGFSLALRSDGTVWAWGSNSVGELGNGSTANSAAPVKVAGLDNVTDIAAGFDSSVVTRTNGISVAKTVWTWGENGAGQLGDGTTANRLTPVQVTGIGTAYIAGLSAGYGFTAVLGTDGRVWAWGNDRVGQLGNARTDTPVTRPVNTIGPGKGIIQISAGGDLMVALVSDGTVLAWGDNTNGELGTGTTTPVTGPVQVTGLTSATQVAAGLMTGFAVHVPVPPAIVPDLTGDTRTRAGQVLQAAGLVLGAVTTVTDKFCAHLGVMSQSPPAGTAVNPGSAVSVTIGQAPPTGCP